MSKKKKQNRVFVALKSSESKLRIYTEKKRVSGHKLSLKKYDPNLRKHVLFTETK
jgi:ribosomal protein L33